MCHRGFLAWASCLRHFHTFTNTGFIHPLIYCLLYDKVAFKKKLYIFFKANMTNSQNNN